MAEKAGTNRTKDKEMKGNSWQKIFAAFFIFNFYSFTIVSPFELLHLASSKLDVFRSFNRIVSCDLDRKRP